MTEGSSTLFAWRMMETGIGAASFSFPLLSSDWCGFGKYFSIHSIFSISSSERSAIRFTAVGLSGVKSLNGNNATKITRVVAKN